MSIKTFKRRLATVQTTSWHYRLVEQVFDEDNLRRSKACTYYWWRVPASLVVAAFYFLSMGFGWVFGFHRDKRKGTKGLFLDYKVMSVDPDSGRPIKKQDVAPWQAMVVLGLLYIIYEVYFASGYGTMFFAMTIAVVIVVGLLYMMYRIGVFRFLGRGAVVTRHVTEDVWDRACPPPPRCRERRFVIGRRQFAGGRLLTLNLRHTQIGNT